MPTRLLASLLLFCTLLGTSHAGGGITHMYLAKESIALLPDTALQTLLTNNLDAYLVGAYYPDSGYVGGNSYGEDSHWDDFIDAFTDYLNTTYQHPTLDNPKLVAFLFGCASHRVSDEIIHWVFYKQSAPKDFHGDVSRAHDKSDLGIDLLVNVDKKQWLAYPHTWWVPVDDLVKIYHRMGKDNYTAAQIIKGNFVISLNGYGERAISLFAYPILEWVTMPWTAAHYDDWPEGGLKMDEKKIAEYQMELWERLQNKSTRRTIANQRHDTSHSTADLMGMDDAMNRGVVQVTAVKEKNGGIEIGQMKIVKALEFDRLVKEVATRLTS